MISPFVLLLLIACNVQIGTSKPSADQLFTSNRKGEQSLAKNSTAPQKGVDESMSKATRNNLHKAHGILMLLAWFLFITIAIIYVRYFRDCKNVWRGTQIWLLMHRTLNVIGVVLIIAGFLCIFISESWTWKGPKVNGGEKNWSASAIHSLVGLLCIILAWIQSLIGFVRPSPSSAMRPLFNWMHRSTGIVAFVLAAATIVIAGYGINRWADRHIALALIIAFIVCLVIAVGVGEMVSFTKTTGSAKISLISSSKDNKSDISFNSNSSIPNVQRRLRFIFVTFGCIAVIIAITLAVLVALSGD